MQLGFGHVTGTITRCLGLVRRYTHATTPAATTTKRGKTISPVQKIFTFHTMVFPPFACNAFVVRWTVTPSGQISWCHRCLERDHCNATRPRAMTPEHKTTTMLHHFNQLHSHSYFREVSNEVDFGARSEAFTLGHRQDVETKLRVLAPSKHLICHALINFRQIVMISTTNPVALLHYRYFSLFCRLHSIINNRYYH